MDVLKGIDNVLERVDVDQEIFDMFIDFTTSLDPEQLSEEQGVELISLFDYIDPELDDDDDDDVDEVRYLRRVSRSTKRKAKVYRRRHKAQIKQYRRRMKHKIRRSRITGRGISGKRMGRTKRRPAPRS